jgi:hypothetical protein
MSVTRNYLALVCDIDKNGDILWPQSDQVTCGFRAVKLKESAIVFLRYLEIVYAMYILYVERCKYWSCIVYVCSDLTNTFDRPALSSEGRHTTILTAIVRTYDINSGHEPQNGLDTKTDRLTDRQL